MLVNIAAASLVLAALSAYLFRWNLFFYTRPALSKPALLPSISVLIPARNEEASIEGAVRSALASEHIELDVFVLDDHSEDRTFEIVERLTHEDRRVHLAKAPPLPEEWCGKQFACSILAGMTSKPLLCFLDADVRLEPCGLAKMAAAMHKSGAALISGFPRQLVCTPAEKLLIPLMHFLLLAYLPFIGMKKSRFVAFAAGCGQLFLAERGAYQQANGHASIKNSRHDGVTLPKAFRRAGLFTDMVDATAIARCRMYRSATQVFYGLSKNATEGIGAPGRILPFTLLLSFGHVLPLVLFAYSLLRRDEPLLLLLAGMALCFSYWPRLLAALRFQQPLGAVIFHPLSVVLLLFIQWYALARFFLRMPASWKGRPYQTT